MISAKYFMLAGLSFLLGQYSITWGYSPKVLERQALGLASGAYYQGCEYAHTHKQWECKAASLKYYLEVQEIWQNKIWSD